MTNAVATISNNDNPWAQVGAGTNFATYMKFEGKRGHYSAGKDDIDIPHGTQFAADVENTAWKWTFWWDGKPLEVVTMLVRDFPKGNDTKYEPDYLPEGFDEMTLEEIHELRADKTADFSEGWRVQGCINLKSLDGDGEEYQLNLSGSAIGGLTMFLAKDYGNNFRKYPGKVPVIELGAYSWVSKNKKIGKRYSPQFKIVRWESEEDLLALQGENPDDYDDYDDEDGYEEEAVEEAPKPKATRQLPPPQEVEEEAPTPQATRRGAAEGARARGPRGTRYA